MSDPRKELPVFPSEAVFSSSGDLGARVCGQEVLLPLEIYTPLQDIGAIKTTTDLFLFLEEFGSETACALGWSPQEMYHAHWSLADILRYHLDPSHVSYPPRQPENFFPKESILQEKVYVQ